MKPQVTQSQLPSQNVWNHDLDTHGFVDTLKRNIGGCITGWNIRYHQYTALLVALGPDLKLALSVYVGRLVGISDGEIAALKAEFRCSFCIAATVWLIRAYERPLSGD